MNAVKKNFDIIFHKRLIESDTTIIFYKFCIIMIFLVYVENSSMTRNNLRLNT